ncbi:glucosyltransferase [Thelephora ganbajun]|uniref:Glucosyltransferase n=1 Tax=Thelephora ganbajun TaxID=370292 RepID=A0ACB6ZM76_THEGA|nr:glucosyltransferase [Thelephora ganbajun]
MAHSPLYHVVFCMVSIMVLKEVNNIITEPYMDEPFHVPQAQAYCNGEWTTWDPKITTPPGLYVLSVIIKRLITFRCNLPVLRLTPLLTLLALPFALTRLLCYHKRLRPPVSFFTPTAESVVLSAFPVAWFFGFLYYTDVPSVLFVVTSIIAATESRHWTAALLGLISCTFRQTNVVWLFYGYISSQLTFLRFRRDGARLPDPPALTASPGDLIRIASSAPKIVLGVLPSFVPYFVDATLFALFVKWNGGIVLGDKANHIPAFHVPQIYYFIAFSTIMGWPALISGKEGLGPLIHGLSPVHPLYHDTHPTPRRSTVTLVLVLLMAFTVHRYTIHHPFLLSDNRHYTFYVWRRIFMLHPVVPYLLIPGYLACGWAWFLRIGADQTLLQALLLPVCVLPVLLPTPLLEPRYFLVPYLLLRAQVVDVSGWGLVLEGVWYTLINAVTMWVFLYRERGGIRFMW